MEGVFFDGLDELYHHAKFGEDRTTRAGCRSENMLFVTMFVFTGRMSRSGKLPVLNLLAGQKSGFRTIGAATRCTDSLQTWQGRRARGSACLCKISPQSPRGWECGPHNIKNFHFFVKCRPAGATPLTDFKIIRIFYTTNYP